MVYRRVADRPLVTKKCTEAALRRRKQDGYWRPPQAPSITTAICAGIGQHLGPAISAVSLRGSTSRSETR